MEARGQTIHGAKVTPEELCELLQSFGAGGDGTVKKEEFVEFMEYSMNIKHTITLTPQYKCEKIGHH